MSKMEEILRERLTPEINSKFVDIYKRAYQANSECFDPSIGHDNMVFGLLIHKSAKYFINQLSLTNTWLDIIQFNPRFLFRVSDFLISSYRVGDTLDVEMANAFPSNNGGAPMLALANQQQMSFEFMKDGTKVPDDTNCRNLILAHRGNASVGLCDLFWGVPSSVDAKLRITEWSSTFEIWRLDSSVAGLRPNEGTPPPRPPVERTALPPLTMRSLSKVQKK
jgi:hypothetical protein